MNKENTWNDLIYNKKVNSLIIISLIINSIERIKFWTNV
jgi:hypothetical protein